MASDIDTYLKELQAALAGADPALVQDALFDAEEHLHAELAAGRAFSDIVDHYGTPAEVAAAYRETTDLPGATRAAGARQAAPAAPPAAAGPGVSPGLGVPIVPAASPVHPSLAGGVPQGGGPSGMGPSVSGPSAPATRPSALREVFGVFVDRRVWTSLLYMLISLGTGVAYFTVVVTMVSLSFGMIVLVIGLPLLLLTLGFVRAMALAEGRLVEALLGTRMPRRPRAEIPGSFFDRLWFWLKDGRTWASLVYLTLMLPIGVTYFTFAVTGVAAGLGLIAAPFVQLATGHDWATWQTNGVTHSWLLPHWLMPISVIVGFLVLLGWFHAFRWIGRGHAAYAKAMLVRLVR